MTYLSMALCLHSCAIYSFTGSSLSSDVKTFSIADFQSDVALGPPDLAERFTEEFSKRLLQRTALSQVDNKGDIQFEGKIKEFAYKPIAPTAGQGTGKDRIDDKASRTRLTIVIEVTYVNPNDTEATFSKRKFSQYEDADASRSTDEAEPELVEKIIAKMIEDIFRATVTSW